MKNIILFFFIICVNSIVFSQNTEIIYGIKPSNGSIESDQKTVSELVRDDFRGVDAEFDNFEFELLINKSKNSRFKTIDKLINNRIANLIVRGISSNGEYYLFNNTTISQRNLSSNEKIYVKIENQNPWVLINETKKIGDYKCLKATKVKELIDGRKILITSWYASKIPLSFGPKEYNGLPGLILELSDDKVTYFVKEIKFNSNKTFDFNVNEKKIISESEFQTLAIDFLEKSKEMLLNDSK
jgi:GLPGLI family protein